MDQEPPSPAFLETVQEIMSIYRSLPPRASIEEVEAAKSVLETVNSEEQMKLKEITEQKAPQDVPEELFSVLQQVRRTMVLFQSYELRREALHVVELGNMFQTFDCLIRKASPLVSEDTLNKQHIVVFGHPIEERGSIFSEESLVKENEDEESEATVLSSDGGDSRKLSMMQVAALIENSAKSGAAVVDLKGKLMDRMESLPVSIGKLSDVTELDLSENRIAALPPTIGGLGALRKLDIHSNQLTNLPDSFGELINLTDLDLRANSLRSLPASFGNLINLINLDLSLNNFAHLPDTIGNLTCLKRLNAETNELSEVPYTIGSCASLVELRLDFNKIRGLPEAIGKLECLEILTLHYNRVQRFPTTMGNLSNLKELDVSFNELEYIPENLCSAPSLKKLIVGKNFADLRALPISIGNLVMLEELDISDNQIRVLPDSFRFLSNLSVFHADDTPLELPPQEVAKLGAEAVVQFMNDFVAMKDAQALSSKKKSGF